MRASVDRRIRVIVVRRRLEESAATLVEHVLGHRPAQHRLVCARLMLLSATVSESERQSVHGLARRAANVYVATSTVLHSRRAFGDLPERLVQEWEHTVTEFEAVIVSQAVQNSDSRDRV